MTELDLAREINKQVTITGKARLRSSVSASGPTTSTGELAWDKHLAALNFLLPKTMCCCFRLLVSRGIYHCWTCFFQEKACCPLREVQNVSMEVSRTPSKILNLHLLKNICYFPLLVVKGIHHHRKYVFLAWGLNQLEVNLRRAVKRQRQGCRP